MLHVYRMGPRSSQSPKDTRSFSCIGSRRLMSGSTVRHRAGDQRTPYQHNKTEGLLSLDNSPSKRPSTGGLAVGGKLLELTCTSNVCGAWSTSLVILLTGRISWMWLVCLGGCKTMVLSQGPPQSPSSISTHLTGRQPLCLAQLWLTTTRSPQEIGARLRGS